MEDYIIITTEYYWHWDLKGTGLKVWEYRKSDGKNDERRWFTMVCNR